MPSTSRPPALAAALAMTHGDLVKESVWRTARLQDAYAELIRNASGYHHQAAGSAANGRPLAELVFGSLAHQNRNAAAMILDILRGRPEPGARTTSPYDEVDRLLEPCRDRRCPLEDDGHFDRRRAEAARSCEIVEALDEHFGPEFSSGTSSPAGTR